MARTVGRKKEFCGLPLEPQDPRRRRRRKMFSAFVSQGGKSTGGMSYISAPTTGDLALGLFAGVAPLWQILSAGLLENLKQFDNLQGAQGIMIVLIN